MINNKIHIEKQTHYGELVSVNTTTEPMRKVECLCLNCKNMNVECKFASALFSVCKDGNIALMVTRCRQYRGIYND